MRICRYNDDRLGLVKGDQLIDVTIALDDLPQQRWPRAHGDAMIANLETTKVGIEQNRKMGYVQGVNNDVLKSPVANPTKIIGAPANDTKHVAEAQDDAEINFGREIKTIDEYRLFLKANYALVGPGEGATLGHTDRRNDHEVELAMIIGKTNLDEFAMGSSNENSAFGNVANPWDFDRAPGGSSGGSACATAAGLAPLALGSDTGGSVRQPAAFCGITAIKPTYGRVSNDGVWPLTPQLDHVGIIARDLDILGRAGRVLIDAPDTDETPDAALKIGVEIDKAGLFDHAYAAELDIIADTLAGAGHIVSPVPIAGRENIAEAHGIIVLSEAAAIYADLDADRRGRLGKAAAAGLRHAENLTEEAVQAAWEWTRAVSSRMATTMTDLDVLISPTLPIALPTVGAKRVNLGGEEVPVVVGMTLLTCLTNLTGNPVVTLPNPRSSATPPSSLQLMGKLGSDAELFGFAGRINMDLQ